MLQGHDLSAEEFDRGINAVAGHQERFPVTMKRVADDLIYPLHPHDTTG